MTDCGSIRLFPPDTELLVFVGHLHPEVLLGICRTLGPGPERCIALGNRNYGGNLDTPGMLFAHGCDADQVIRHINRHLESH